MKSLYKKKNMIFIALIMVCNLVLFLNAGKGKGGAGGKGGNVDYTCTYGPWTEFGAYQYNTNSTWTAIGNFQTMRPGETKIFELFINSGNVASSTCGSWRVNIEDFPEYIREGFSIDIVNAFSSNGAIVSLQNGMVDILVTPGSKTTVQFAVTAAQDLATGSATLVPYQYSLWNQAGAFLFKMGMGTGESPYGGSQRTGSAKAIIQ